MRITAVAVAVLALFVSLVALGDRAGISVAAAASSCAESGQGSDISSAVSGTLSGDSRTLSVRLVDRDYVLTAVGVGSHAGYRLYTGGPFSGMTAPENPGGQPSKIRDWYACGSRASEPTRSPNPPDRPRPPTATSTPTTTPEPTASAEPTDPPETTSTSEPTDSPEATDSPEPTDSPEATEQSEEPTYPPVPTSIPGGLASTDGVEPFGMLALVGLGFMAAAGVVLMLRHRRVHG